MACYCSQCGCKEGFRTQDELLIHKILTHSIENDVSYAKRELEELGLTRQTLLFEIENTSNEDTLD